MADSGFAFETSGAGHRLPADPRLESNLNREATTMQISLRGEMQRRRFLRTAALASGAALLPGFGMASRARAAVQLTSVAAMVAEAEVAWEQSMVDKWNQLHPDAKWEPERVGWEAIFEKVLAYESAGSPPNLGYGWTGFTADWHQMDIIEAPEDHLGKEWKDRFAEHLTTSGGDVIDGKLW